MSGFGNHKSTVLVRQLRDYGWSGQWGLEPTYQQYLDHLIEFMVEVKRALKPEGTIWINLGDTYSTQSGSMGSGKWTDPKNPIASNTTFTQSSPEMQKKCLMLIPQRFAIRCIDELDLILRNDIIWAKRNGMPESVTDRFSKKHEFFFFFAKQEKYYFDLDAIRDKQKEISIKRSMSINHLEQREDFGSKSFSISSVAQNSYYKKFRENYSKGILQGKNPGDVSDFWDITTKANSAEHYAAFNSELIDKPIVSGSPKGGIICDPFCGTGTTLFRSYELGRNFIGNDGKKEYVDDANKLWQEIRSQERLFQ